MIDGVVSRENIITPKLSDDIFPELRAHGGGPLKVEHPSAGEVCWIIMDEQKQRLFEFDDSGEVDPREVS